MNTKEPKEPIHVEFARSVLNWADIYDFCGDWRGLQPIYQRAVYEQLSTQGVFRGSWEDWFTAYLEPLPRVDLPGYDLLEWQSVNHIDLVWIPATGWWNASPQGGLMPDCETPREAVLKCLIALFREGKGVKPEGV